MIGLTGGIASGKTTVLNMLQELGAATIDADVLARQMIAPQGPCIDQVRKDFPSAVHSDGSINRKALAAIIFSDSEQRRRLESIIHPPVLAEIERLNHYYKQDGRRVVADIPLLFEVHVSLPFDQIWVVFVDEQTQIDRLMERDGMEPKQALERIQAQLPLEEKCRHADCVIDNRFGVDYTEQQVRDFWHSYCANSRAEE